LIDQTSGVRSNLGQSKSLQQTRGLGVGSAAKDSCKIARR
jgi:hypothetical protein